MINITEICSLPKEVALQKIQQTSYNIPVISTFALFVVLLIIFSGIYIDSDAGKKKFRKVILIPTIITFLFVLFICILPTVFNNIIDFFVNFFA